MKRMIVIFKKPVFTAEKKTQVTVTNNLKVELTRVFDLESKFNDFAKTSKSDAGKLRELFYESLTREEQQFVRTYFAEFKSDEDFKVALSYFSKNELVEDVREDLLNELSFTPNDPLLANLWAMPKISARQAWNISTGYNVVVAVCDTGVDSTHPDLAPNMWRNSSNHFGYDFSNNDTDPSDYHGHGTHVAGTIAAAGNNATGVVGVSYRAKIMAVKIFPNAYNSVCAQAIQYAANNGAKLVNCSWGPASSGPVATDPTLKAAIDYAYNLGCYCVFAAGNYNIDASTQFPANYPKVITVSATDQNDIKAGFSNWGNVVDIAAPGVNILSTQRTGGYVSMQGTSMAAPHITGASALLLAHAPNLSFDNLRYFLRKSADPIAAQNISGLRLNCYKLVAPAIQTYRRQTFVETAFGRYALHNNAEIAYMYWNNAWVQNLVQVWGPAIVSGSISILGDRYIAAVNTVSNAVVTYGQHPNFNYGVITQTFGIVPGTLRYSRTKDALFGVNVFNDFVYIKWHNNTWNMNIVPCWGGQIVPSSVELSNDQKDVIAINANNEMCHTWNDPNGTIMIDGTKLSFSVHTPMNGLIP